MIKNTAPQAFNLLSYEIGFTRLRVVHASPVDLDINKRTVWYTSQGTPPTIADSRVDFDYVGEDYFALSGLSISSPYDFTLTLVDDFVAANETLLNEQNVNATILAPYKLANVSTLAPTTISNVVNNVGSGEIGAPPSTVGISLAGTGGNVNIQVSSDNKATWSSVYTGVYIPEVLVTLAPGTYHFRVLSSYLFSDGYVDDGGSFEYGSTVDVGNSINNPSPISGLTITGYKDSSVSASYLAVLDWAHVNTGGANRHYTVLFMEYDGVTSGGSLDWSNAGKVSTTETAYTFTNFPLRRQYAFRIIAHGWAENDSTAVYGYAYITTDTNESSVPNYILVQENPYVTATNIQIDDKFIRGYSNYDADVPANNVLTFEFDAATGDFTMGSNAELFYDASASILAIDGSVITNQIIAADYVMGWLGGEAPEFRTINKTGYGVGTSGIWMGYTGVNDTDFKFDMGDATQYIRWDGSTMYISGQVQLGAPGASIDLGDAGTVPVTIYREDSDYFTFPEEVQNSIPANTTIAGADEIIVPRTNAEAITVSVLITNGTNDTKVALNDVEIGDATGGGNEKRWYHFQGTSVAGNNSIKIWHAGAGVLRYYHELVVTYGIPTGDTPSGWTETRPSEQRKVTVHSTNNKNSGGTVTGVWSVPIGIIASDGNEGNKIEYRYQVASTPTAPGDGYDPDPAGWQAGIPIYNQGDKVWVIQCTKDHQGNVLIPWTAPSRWNADKGADGDPGTDGSGFYPQTFPYTDTGANVRAWSYVDGNTTNAHTMATDFIQKTFNRAPVDFEVVTQYNQAAPSQAQTYMYKSGSWSAPELAVHGDMVVDGTIRGKHVETNTLGATHISADAITAKHLKVSAGDDLASPPNNTIIIDPKSESPVVIRDDLTGQDIFRIESNKKLDPDDPASSLGSLATVVGQAGFKFCRTVDSISDVVKRDINPYWNAAANNPNHEAELAGLPVLMTSPYTSGTISVIPGGDADTYVNTVNVRAYIFKETRLAFSPTDYGNPIWNVKVTRTSPTIGTYVLIDENMEGSSSNSGGGGAEPEYNGWSELNIDLTLEDPNVPVNTTCTYSVTFTRQTTTGSDTPTTLNFNHFSARVPSHTGNALIKSSQGYWKDKESGFIILWGDASIAGDSSSTVTWHQAFPNDALQAFVSMGTGFDTNTDAGVAVYDITSTTGVIQNGSATSKTIRYLVMGY